MLNFAVPSLSFRSLLPTSTSYILLSTLFIQNLPTCLQQTLQASEKLMFSTVSHQRTQLVPLKMERLAALFGQTVAKVAVWKSSLTSN